MMNFETSFTSLCAALRDDPRSTVALSREAGLDPTTVRAIRTGEYRPKSIRVLVALEKLLPAAEVD